MSDVIKFRPLRKLKSGKIAIASYGQWRSIMTADYKRFELIVIDEYKHLPDDTLVHNHKGENLFFYDYNPVDVEVFVYPLIPDEKPKMYGIDWGGNNKVNYSMPGADCDGVPAFHYTADTMVNCKADLDNVVTLTVGIVKHWLGWFLYRLENNRLTFN